MLWIGIPPQEMWRFSHATETDGSVDKSPIYVHISYVEFLSL